MNQWRENNLIRLLVDYRANVMDQIQLWKSLVEDTPTIFHIKLFHLHLWNTTAILNKEIILSKGVHRVRQNTPPRDEVF